MALHTVQDSVDRFCDFILGYVVAHSEKVLGLLDHLFVLIFVLLTKLRAKQNDELGRIEAVVLFRTRFL